MSDDEEPKRRLKRAPTSGEASSRHEAVRLKTAHKRTPSSQAWLERQLNDPYVALAAANGYRSRAAFKLTEIDDRFRLIRRGSRVVDLGCAPGGWLQVALERGAAKVAGVDLLPVEPVAGAEIVQADFTRPGVGEAVIARLGGAPDLVMSDMAPNTVGHKQTDHLRIVGLIEAAAEFAVEHLQPGGAFISKAFQGGETESVLARLRRSFTAVKHVKPKASRAGSSEVFLVATGSKGG